MRKGKRRQAMASALDMIRHYSKKKKLCKIKEAGDHLLIGKLSVPKKMKTHLVASGPKQDGAPEKFYTMESLVFFLQHVDAWERSYVRYANYNNISIIHEDDRQPILAYFSGQGPSLEPCSKPIDEAVLKTNPGNSENAAREEQQPVQLVPNPLALLRQHVASKAGVAEQGAYVIFGDIVWPKNMKTNLQIAGTGQEGTPKEYYTLNCLIFFLKNALLPHPAYVRRAKAENIQFVRSLDRVVFRKFAYFHSLVGLRLARRLGKGLRLHSVHAWRWWASQQNLLKYLNGELDSIPNLNENVMYAFPFGTKRPAIEPPAEQPVAPKRTRIIDDLVSMLSQKSRVSQSETEGPPAPTDWDPVDDSAVSDLVESLVEQPVETKGPKLPADPLTVLRNHIIEEKQITVKDGNMIFGELAWPKNTRTNYQIWGSGRNGKPKEYYTLECLLCFLRNVSQRHPAYVNQAQAEKVPFVRRPDRKKLLDYLKGVTSSSDSLDLSVLPETSQMQSERAQFKAKTNNIAKSTESDQISLSEALSLERIAAIKAKRLANKLKS